MKSWLTHGIGAGGCMDAAVDGAWLYVISNTTQYTAGRGGCLQVWSLEDPASPRQAAIVPDLGNVRQIIVSDGYAYISAREDGIWIVDVNAPEAPFIAAHYDPIELATGLALDGCYLFAACRLYGIEVIDISVRTEPRHAAVLRTGEAQSLDVQDGIIYAGVWGTMEVVVIDARDLNAPRQLARIPLQGRGDGVCVRGNLLYAATGHHRRTASGLNPSPDDPAYGGGSGLEIYDVTVPERPVFLSRTQLPERFYYPVFDMWSVTVANGYAFLTFSFHGAVAMDVHDPRHPEIIARWIAWIPKEDPSYFDLADPKRTEKFVPLLTFDPGEGMISPATNLALGSGYLYTATGFSDLYVIPFAAAKQAHRRGPAFSRQRIAEEETAFVRYRPDAQVRAVCVIGRRVLAACGSGGVHELRLTDNGGLELQRVVSTRGFAFDISVCGERVLVAEGQEGVSIRDVRTLAEGSRYRDGGGRVIQQLMPSPDGRFVLIHAGYGLFQFLDVRDMETPRLALSDGNEMLGGIYGRQICTGILAGRYMAAHWNSRFIRWYDAGGETPRPLPWKQPHIGFQGGMAICRDKALAVWKGGYFLFDPTEEDPFTPDACVRIPGVTLRGKPVVHGDLLFVSDRVLGEMQALDISDIRHPRMLFQEETKGNPDLARIAGNHVFWPLGYAGLACYPLDLFRGRITAPSGAAEGERRDA